MNGGRASKQAGGPRVCVASDAPWTWLQTDRRAAPIYHSHSRLATSDVRGRISHWVWGGVEVREKEERKCGRTHSERLHVEDRAVAPTAWREIRASG